MQNEDKYTSLNLSRKLKEAGCEIESEKAYYIDNIDYQNYFLEKVSIMKDLTSDKKLGFIKAFNAYDIMNDICWVHAKEFFGEGVFDDKYEETKKGIYSRVKNPTEHILYLMRKGDKKGAEDYIIKHSVFFKLNRI